MTVTEAEELVSQKRLVFGNEEQIEAVALLALANQLKRMVSGIDSDLADMDRSAVLDSIYFYGFGIEGAK